MRPLITPFISQSHAAGTLGMMSGVSLSSIRGASPSVMLILRASAKSLWHAHSSNLWPGSGNMGMENVMEMWLEMCGGVAIVEGCQGDDDLQEVNEHGEQCCHDHCSCGVGCRCWGDCSLCLRTTTSSRFQCNEMNITWTIKLYCVWWLMLCGISGCPHRYVSFRQLATKCWIKTYNCCGPDLEPAQVEACVLSIWPNEAEAYIPVLALVLGVGKLLLWLQDDSFMQLSIFAK